MSVILGIDPGSRITGFGVIRVSGCHSQEYITCGCIRTASGSLPQRLLTIHQGLSEIITRYAPDKVAVEQVFMHQHANAALVLGHARGAILLTLAQCGLICEEYSPRRIKQSIVGYGGAEKSQVQHMVKTLLGLSQAPSVDAADALAVALCSAYA